EGLGHQSDGQGKVSRIGPGRSKKPLPFRKIFLGCYDLFKNFSSFVAATAFPQGITASTQPFTTPYPHSV
ncbi:MAG: hypothetical protein AVDCRST_MAG56-492, partial [uncultured Cytophagales bacterium]